jgi:hypothetical protein
MATNEEILRAFENYNNLWKTSRSGLIIGLTGARVGTWIYRNNTLIVDPEDDDFKKDFRKLSKEGIIVREPSRRLEVEDEDVDPGDASVLRILPISQAGPGDLDSSLKIMGYFMIETDLPLAKE